MSPSIGHRVCSLTARSSGLGPSPIALPYRPYGLFRKEKKVALRMSAPIFLPRRTCFKTAVSQSHAALFRIRPQSALAECCLPVYPITDTPLTPLPWPSHLPRAGLSGRTARISFPLTRCALSPMIQARPLHGKSPLHTRRQIQNNWISSRRKNEIENPHRRTRKLAEDPQPRHPHWSGQR